MNKHERKFKNTARKMQDVLIGLIEQKEFDEITVSDICRLAGVNRSTFYAHYRNTVDLLEEEEQDMILTFDEALNHICNVNLLSECPEFSDGSLLLNDHVLTFYLSFVKEHQRVFRIYNDKKPLFHNKEHFYQFKNLFFKRIYQRFTELSDTNITYISLYYLAGIEAIVEQWVNTNCNETEEEICNIIKFCIIGKRWKH